ncbi:MAG: PadR family transcriptional regulator [Pseudomonadota bacterium]
MYHRKRMHKAAAAYKSMRGGSRRPRRRRPLNHGDLRLLILSLIAEQPRHGYDLITEIEHLTGGNYKPSPGVMYPALSVIEDLGFAKAKKEDGKRVFYITPEGEAEIEEKSDTLAKIENRLEALASSEHDYDPTDVRSASRNLRYAVFKLVANDWPDTSKYEDIVGILNRAREDINALGNESGKTAG